MQLKCRVFNRSKRLEKRRNALAHWAFTLNFESGTDKAFPFMVKSIIDPTNENWESDGRFHKRGIEHQNLKQIAKDFSALHAEMVVVRDKIRGHLK